MASSTSNVENRFWSTVWPQLETGAWRYKMCPRPKATSAADGTSDDGTVVAAAAADDVNSTIGSNTIGSVATNGNSSSGSADGEGGGDRKRRRGRRDSAGEEMAAAAAAAGAAEADEIMCPVFFPPAPGVASEALEEAMRRNLPADGSAGDERLDRLEGIEAVIEVLQQVPGYPGTTSFGMAPNMEAVAAAARAVIVRTPPLEAAAKRPPEAVAAKRAEVGLPSPGQASRSAYVCYTAGERERVRSWLQCKYRCCACFIYTYHTGNRAGYDRVTSAIES